MKQDNLILRVELPNRGLAIEVDDIHNNIFMLRDINDKTQYGNLGLYSTFWYDSQYTLEHYYCVPLFSLYDVESEYDAWLRKSWDVFCKKNKISKWKNSRWRTTKHRGENTAIEFVKWLKKYDTQNLK